jgi:hypothetical protein
MIELLIIVAILIFGWPALVIIAAVLQAIGILLRGGERYHSLVEAGRVRRPLH